MDKRIRRLQRAYNESKDAIAHSTLLGAANRAGLLQTESLIIAAFIKHRGSRIVGENQGWAKPDGVVHNGRLLRNLEIRDLLRNFFFLPHRIMQLAGLSMVHALTQIDDTYNFEDYLDYLDRNIITKRKYNFAPPVFPMQAISTGIRFDNNLRYWIFVLTNSICRKKNGYASLWNTMPSASGLIEDELIIKGMQKIILPEVLGEYR